MRRVWSTSLPLSRFTKIGAGGTASSRGTTILTSHTTLQEFERVVFGQDQEVVESQRPEQVPFDLAEELHLPFDAVAVNYRRTMQKQGFAYYPYLNEVEEDT